VLFGEVALLVGLFGFVRTLGFAFWLCVHVWVSLFGWAARCGFAVWLVSARFVLLPHPDPSLSVTVSGVCQGGKDALTNPRNR
jgi:hypothetical protein